MKSKPKSPHQTSLASRRLKSAFAISLSIPFGSFCESTRADTLWTGALDQDWNNAANWNNGVPVENGAQGAAFINTATGNFPSITAAGTYQADWDLRVGAGTSGRLDQSNGTLATGEGNWFFLGYLGVQATYNQTGSAGLKVGGLVNPIGNLLIGLDNGTVSTWNVNTTGTTQAGGIFAGANGASTGIINMTAGTVDVSGEMQMGASFFDNGGIGELNMTGGTVTANIVAFARGSNNVAAVSGTGVISGGTLNSRQWFTLGFAGNGSNIAAVTHNGGTVNVNTSGGGLLEMGVFDATTNLYTLDSGSLNLQNNASIGFGQGGNHSGTSTFTQNGGTVTFFSDGGTITGGIGSVNLGNGGSTGTYVYALNGGTLTAPSISKSGAGANGSFSFNGGTLRPTGSTTTFMQGLNTASIQIGGAIIDTNGSDITIAQALLDSGGGLTKQGIGTLTLAGANTYSGNTTVQSGGQLTLADNGSLQFVAGANGVNNQLGGNGAVQLDGDFMIDVTGASTTAGHSWTLVNVSTLAENYGSTFTVVGWTEATPGVWNSPSGPYRFTESTGVLDVFNGDVDGDGMADSFEQVIITADLTDSINTINDVLPQADFDSDGTDNLTEFRLGLIPNDPNSRFSVNSSDNNTSDGYAVSWQGKAGLTFTVERSTTLTSGSWAVIHTVTPSADGAQSFIDPAPVPEGKSFYRVTLAP